MPGPKLGCVIGGQGFVVDGCPSDWKSATSDVPQGSVLGPLYKYDFHEKEGDLSKFAGDTKK